MEPLMSHDENFFSNLPPHIIIDILTRLPTKTISRCRCVCKVWLKLVSSPEFVNLRKLRPPTSLMIFVNVTSFNMVELENEPASHDFYYLPGSTMELPERFGTNLISMFGSVNGLLCFQEFAGRSFKNIHLWNPTTLESITIRSPEGVMEHPNISTYGFGLSSVNGHYKVVSIYQELEWEGQASRITKSECHVYTFGHGYWRHLGHAPFMYNCRAHGLFFNGNLYWLIIDPDGSELISCFDLEKESFKPFPAPPELEKNNLASLEVFRDDCLSVCDNTSDSEITIWVMKEYGVRESWVKEFVIDKHPIDLVGEYCEVVRMLRVFEDGEILLFWRDDLLLSYNSKSNSLQVVDIRKFVPAPESFEIMEVVYYAPSFLSLKSFGVEMVEETN